MFVSGEGQFEIHLFASAVVHVKGKLRILHQFLRSLYVLGGDVVQYLLTGIGIAVDDANRCSQECAGLATGLRNANGLYAGHHEPAAHHIDTQHLARCMLAGDSTSQSKHHRLSTAQGGGGFFVQKFSKDRLAHATFHPFNSIYINANCIFAFRPSPF